MLRIASAIPAVTKERRDASRTVASASASPERPRIEVWLVGGCHVLGDPEPWTVVGRDGQPTLSLERARLFTFDMSGFRKALAASGELKKTWLPAQVAFTARVIVTGDPFEPDEVVAAWTVERAHPVDIRWYPFQVRP